MVTKYMTSDMLSQEEIDALLKGTVDSEPVEELLSEIEKDALGEIGNISMGTSATTLYTLLGQKVTITTPKVTITSTDELAEDYKVPFVAVDVKYKEGLSGVNLLILKMEDVKVISDIMMGGDGTNNRDREMNEMDLSAISEAMNQMVGSSSTSLSEMLGAKIDIEPPRAFEINFVQNNLELEFFNYEEAIVKVSFNLTVGNLIDSEIMQLIPISFAKKMVNDLLFKNNESLNSYKSKPIEEQYEQTENETTKNVREANRNTTKHEPEPVNVKKVQFESFDKEDKLVYNENIELIKEVPIGITVELGRTTKKISEILEYGPGTILELNKLVGEPLDILANGKYIAKGEVVVIDDNFGIRITNIIKPSKRIS